MLVTCWSSVGGTHSRLRGTLLHNYIAYFVFLTLNFSVSKTVSYQDDYNDLRIQSTLELLFTCNINLSMSFSAAVITVCLIVHCCISLFEFTV